MPWRDRSCLSKALDLAFVFLGRRPGLRSLLLVVRLLLLCLTLLAQTLAAGKVADRLLQLALRLFEPTQSVSLTQC